MKELLKELIITLLVAPFYAVGMFLLVIFFGLAWPFWVCWQISRDIYRLFDKN